MASKAALSVRALKEGAVTKSLEEWLEARGITTLKGYATVCCDVPEFLCADIEPYCDAHNIPCYHVDEELFSFGGSYSALLAFERSR